MATTMITIPSQGRASQKEEEQTTQNHKRRATSWRRLYQMKSIGFPARLLPFVFLFFVRLQRVGEHWALLYVQDRIIPPRLPLATDL
jgi:hypothetical protein